MVIDSFQKRFLMNMQLRQCISKAKPFRLKKKTEKARFCLAFFDFQKCQRCSKKARISEPGFKKAKLATLLSAQSSVLDLFQPILCARET